MKPCQTTHDLARALKDRGMTNNETPGPVIQDKQSDNLRASQYNEISCFTDSIRDMQDPLLLDDEISAKSFNLKRQADDVIVPGKRSRTSMTTDTNKRLETFACPYYRKNPERFLDCMTLKMPRIADVKQHLKRRHTSNYSCTRCHEGFSSSKAYEEHVLLQSCPITDCNNNDGVSPVAQQALKDRFNRSSSSERQWHDIYMILFGQPKISLNPYRDGVFKEVTGIIRGILENEDQTIISSLKETRNIPSADQLRPLLLEFLTRVEISFEQKGKKPSRGKPQERRKITKDSPRGSSDKRNVEHNETSLGVQGLKSNNGELEIDGPYRLPMQDWQFPVEFGASDYIFNYSMPLAYQTERANDPHDDLSTSLPSHDERGIWPSMGRTSAAAAENIMPDQSDLFIP